MKVSTKSIEGRTPFVPINSDLSSSDPSSIVVNTCKNSYSALDLNVSNFLQKSTEAVLVKAIVSLQHQEGLRISEVINIRPEDVKSGLRIFVKGKKRSESRIVTPVNYRKFWQQYSEQQTTIGDVFSRHFFKRLYVKYGLYMDLGAGKKRAVTHAMRHNYVNSLRREGVERKDVQHHIGHKSETSTKYYEHE